MLGGLRPASAFVKLPFIPPSTSQNTKSGPYADVIAYGQSKVADGVIDVSVSSGFTLGDTPKNGMSVIVTATTQEKATAVARDVASHAWRSEEHTSELQSLMRISYAVFCLKKKNTQQQNTKN